MARKFRMPPAATVAEPTGGDALWGDINRLLVSLPKHGGGIAGLTGQWPLGRTGAMVFKLRELGDRARRCADELKAVHKLDQDATEAE
jgi:hypothetical protein